MGFCNCCGVPTGEEHDNECTYGGIPIRWWVDEDGKIQYEEIQREVD